MSKGTRAPTAFITKTFGMIEDEETDSVISWTPSGTSFVVWDESAFAKDLLPASFKHNNMSSFLRQLNIYGFRKVNHDRLEFSREDFLKGRGELLANIHRISGSNNTDADDQTLGHGSYSNYSAPAFSRTDSQLFDARLSSQETALKEQVERTRSVEERMALHNKLWAAHEQACQDIHKSVYRDRHHDQLRYVEMEGRMTAQELTTKHLQERNEQKFDFMSSQNTIDLQRQERRSLDLEERIDAQERTNKIQKDRNLELEERLLEQEKLNRQNQVLIQEFIKRSVGSCNILEASKKVPEDL
jgi:hypothetical protein